MVWSLQAHALYCTVAAMLCDVPINKWLLLLLVDGQPDCRCWRVQQEETSISQGTKTATGLGWRVQEARGQVYLAGNTHLALQTNENGGQVGLQAGIKKSRQGSSRCIPLNEEWMLAVSKSMNAADLCTDVCAYCMYTHARTWHNVWTRMHNALLKCSWCICGQLAEGVLMLPCRTYLTTVVLRCAGHKQTYWQHWTDWQALMQVGVSTVCSLKCVCKRRPPFTWAWFGQEGLRQLIDRYINWRRPSPY